MNQESERRTPLSQASFDGDLDLVNDLLKAGVDYLETDAYGRTALHWAVAQRHIDVVHALLSHHQPQNIHKTPVPLCTLTYKELKELASCRPEVDSITLPWVELVEA